MNFETEAKKLLAEAVDQRLLAAFAFTLIIQAQQSAYVPSTR
jgi:hypothetical protein